LDGIFKIRREFEEKGLNPILEKRCLQAVLKDQLVPFCLEQQRISAETFRSLFDLLGWMELWTEDELGWWYTLGLSQYGPALLSDLINQSFPSKSEALIWLFLGAHH
jgi:hypothetical protein